MSPSKTKQARQRRRTKTTTHPLNRLMDEVFGGTVALIAKWKADPSSGFVCPPLHTSKAEKGVRFRTRSTKKIRQRIAKLEARLEPQQAVPRSKPVFDFRDDDEGTSPPPPPPTTRRTKKPNINFDD